MSAELDELYLEWLYEQVGKYSRNPRSTHWDLLKQMYSTEFVWFVPNDDNRMEDGRALRYEFVEAAGLDRVPAEWMGMGCSFLEMLIGMARILAFEAGGRKGEWFWHMLENVSLEKCTDARYANSPQAISERVSETLEMIIWRTYLPDGQGGLFPLRDPKEDQRQVELWYQMSAYILELD